MTYTKTQLDNFAAEINSDWTSEYYATVDLINGRSWSLCIEVKTESRSLTILELQESGKIIDHNVDSDAREQLDYMLNR